MSFLLFLLLVNQPLQRHCLPDGLHPTPPMGWSSWNTFFSYNSEEKMIAQADALLSLGLADLGYTTLTIDDRWHLEERDEEGRMVADPGKFPSGIKFLADYMHQRGLRLGLYSSAGVFTCSGFLPGSLAHEREDVAMLVDWGVDYLKYDNCFPRMDGSTNVEEAYIDFAASAEHFPSIWQDPSEEVRYTVMGEALAEVRQEHNITFELCAWGFGNVERFGPAIGHLWRTGPDISDNWQSLLWNIDINDEDRFQGEFVQGPARGWNYPDALFVGKGGMSEAEYRSMFALWALVKAPLMLGVDLTTVTKDSPAYRIITNPGLLAVNQDSLGIQGRCVKDCCSHGSLGGLTAPYTCQYFHNSWQIWMGPLAGDAWVVVIVNRFDKEESVLLNWESDAGLTPGRYSLTDLWHGESLGEVEVGGLSWEGGDWKGILPAHDSWAFRLQLLNNTF